MERAIRVANESGVIIIRQQPNQFGSRPTTGAYVQLDNPVVLDVLGLRDKVLDRLIQVYSDRDVVLRDPLEMALAETVGYSDPDPMEWLQLLVNHQILAHSATAEGENGYSLNRQHPVVARRNALVS